MPNAYSPRFTGLYGVWSKLVFLNWFPFIHSIMWDITSHENWSVNFRNRGTFSLFPMDGWDAGEKSAIRALSAYKLHLILNVLEDLAFLFFLLYSVWLRIDLLIEFLRV